jgi:hypothetical protein
MKYQKTHETTNKQINKKMEKLKTDIFYFHMLKEKRDNLEKIMTDFFKE